jgi:hypothetical protein
MLAGLNDWKVATCEVMKTAMLNVLETTHGDEATTLMRNVSFGVGRLKAKTDENWSSYKK